MITRSDSLSPCMERGAGGEVKPGVWRYPSTKILFGAALLLMMLTFTACTDATPAPQPTTTTEWFTSLPPIAASPTVNPIAPLAEGPTIREQAPDTVGASNPTQASLAAEGQPDQDLPTITPLPTEAQLPILISAADGLILNSTLYNAAARPAPGVLIMVRDRAAWGELALRLQARGYAVLLVDLRGYGTTGGSTDWVLAQDDAHAALSQFSQLPGIASSQITVIGAGIGANLLLSACSSDLACGGAILLSPGLDYLGITTPDAVARLGTRPMLIVASENDDNNPADSIALDSMARGDHQLIIYPAQQNVDGHGAALLTAQPGLLDTIANWLLVRFPVQNQ
ncbi:MAG: alpha/beta fold hydrolase [Anaerolineae bacterium]|nr:alpha/beta fold hydrolase [Anaerolineae bacterium]